MFCSHDLIFNAQSLAGTLFNIRLDNTLPPGYLGNSSTIDLATIRLITPPELRDEVLNAVARSIQVCFVHDGIAVAVFSLQVYPDNLDVVLSVPRRGSSSKSLVSHANDTVGLFRRPSQLTILMRTTFGQDGGKNETVEQTQTPSKEKADAESTVSSQC